jgi:hypothetical protein
VDQAFDRMMKGVTTRAARKLLEIAGILPEGVPICGRWNVRWPDQRCAKVNSVVFVLRRETCPAAGGARSRAERATGGSAGH